MTQHAARARFARYIDRDITPNIDAELFEQYADRRTWYDEPDDIMRLRRTYAVTLVRRSKSQRIADVVPWSTSAIW